MQNCQTKQDKKNIWGFRLINLIFGFATATMGFIVLFLESTGLSPTQVGVVMSFNSALGAIAPPLWALIADKLRSRYRVFLLSATMGAIAFGFVPLSAQIRMFGIVLSAVLIPAASFFRIPGFSMLDTMAMEACRSVGGHVEFSSIRVWRSIGMSAMNMIYSPFINRIGPGFAFYGFSFFILVILLLRSRLKPFELAQPKGQKAIPLKELKVSRLVKDYYLVVFVLINLLMMVPQNGQRYIVYLVAQVGGDTANIGIINSIRIAANVLIMFAAPNLKRKIGLPGTLMLASVSFMAQGILFQFCQSTFQIALISTLGGFGMGLNVATGVNYVSLMAPKGLEATAISLFSIGNPTMGIIANTVSGAVIENFGARTIFLVGFAAAFLWMMVFLLSFFIGARLLKKEPPLPLWPPVTDRDAS